MGAAFVAIAAVVVRVLGVLRLGLAVIAGQLVGALLLDVAAARCTTPASTRSPSSASRSRSSPCGQRARATAMTVLNLLKLLVGLVLFAVGLWLGLVAELGVGPWDVLTGGLSEQLGHSFGRTAIAVSVVSCSSAWPSACGPASAPCSTSWSSGSSSTSC